MEDGEWMYHNKLNAPECKSDIMEEPRATLTPSASMCSSAAGKKDNTRGQLLLSWSGIITCLCIRRNKTQALLQLDSFLTKYDDSVRLRAVAMDLKAFLTSQTSIPGFPSSLSSPSAAQLNMNFPSVVSNEGLKSLGAPKEVISHVHAPATAFRWQITQLSV
jgi:hypothetical protein